MLNLRMGVNMENQPVEIVFSFDTTGSMYPCLDTVRRNIEETISPLFKEIPNLKIGICAHGDYCDASHAYVTKWLPLTNNMYDLTQFVRGVERTGGGDAEECYEYVLNQARYMNWSVNSKKVFVLIGDDRPHSPSYSLNKNKLDWREETRLLTNIGVDVYTVQCLGRSYAKPFWEEVAQIGHGHRLILDQFSEILNLLLSITYKQIGGEYLKKFEENLEKNRSINRSLDRSFGVLSGRKKSIRFEDLPSGLIPVEPGRFQILDVHRDQDIKSFVLDNDLIFNVGQGFYEFTKTEDIQEKKEVVIRDRITGDMFTGTSARELIGVPLGTRGRVRPEKTSKYQIFVQSTSNNRKLKANTKFLYEVGKV